MFSDTSSQDRKLIWHAAWKMIVWRPWLGLGLGTFMFNFDRFVAKGYIFDAPYAHNCYLQIAAELGMVGLLVFLAIIIIFFWQGIRLLNSRQRSFFWYILLASLGAMAGYCFQMGMDTIFYSLDLGLLFWILLGLGTVAMNVLKSEHPCCIGETSAA
jgi:putative inorganic carbon (HCO3(-)) transporter